MLNSEMKAFHSKALRCALAPFVVGIFLDGLAKAESRRWGKDVKIGQEESKPLLLTNDRIVYVEKSMRLYKETSQSNKSLVDIK